LPARHTHASQDQRIRGRGGEVLILLSRSLPARSSAVQQSRIRATDRFVFDFSVTSQRETRQQ